MIVFATGDFIVSSAAAAVTVVDNVADVVVVVDIANIIDVIVTVNVIVVDFAYTNFFLFDISAALTFVVIVIVSDNVVDLAQVFVICVICLPHSICNKFFVCSEHVS